MVDSRLGSRLLGGGLLSRGRLLHCRGLLRSGLGTAGQFGTSRRLFLDRTSLRSRRSKRGWKRRRHLDEAIVVGGG